jgi:ribA/ribD-fused uncharacterized protein
MISSFTGQYEFLSNFYTFNMWYDGDLWPSVENAYQAQKTLDWVKRQQFLRISSGRAKRLGRALTDIRPDWDTLKNNVMLDLLRVKFSHQTPKEMLLATGEEDLLEGNDWHDNWFGSCTCDQCGDKGFNHLGKLLMKVREELK